MRELIYYPTFEITDSDWIKFALLYINQLDPIIPESGEIYLSDNYKKLINETDLIKPLRPGYSEGENATLDAIDHIEKILRHPNAYISIFNEENFLDKWRSIEHQYFTLFREKYTDYWEDFCIKNKLAHKAPQGLLISKDVVNIYMTILAQCIADSRGISPITDNQSLDRFSIFSRKTEPTVNDVIQTAQSIIKLTLPQNISAIPVDEIIEHRNMSGFKEKQKAFHDEIENYLREIEENPNPENFKRHLGNIWQDFSDDIVQIGSGTIAFSLGVWLLFQSSGNLALPAAEKIAGGVALTVGSIISIKKTWQNTNTRRMARRYLGSIGSLQAASV